MIIVTSYENSDADGCGGALAYAELLRAQGKDARAGFYGAPSLEAQFVFREHNFEVPKFHADAGDEVVTVDASESPYLKFIPNFDKVIEIIDHRKNNDAETFKNAKVQIELVGAAATLVAERFVSAGVTPTRDSALFLYAGIISNTLNFHSTGHTDRDIKMAEWLRGIANPPTDFIHRMFSAKSDLTGPILANEMDTEMGHYDFAGTRLGFTQLEIINGDKLVADRLDEIKQELIKLKASYKTDLMFLSVNDLEGDCNYFITPDEALEPVLEKLLDINFKNGLAKRPGHIMRKQIVPLLREYYEQK